MKGAWRAELAFAHHLADLADRIGIAYFRQERTEVRMKADGTPVTQADEEIEYTLRAEISSAYPDHGVLGEEGGLTGPEGSRWIIDPIDGTKNFSWGIPIWATLIALEAEGEVVCGVASAPALHERYYAARGEGAGRNGQRIRVSAVNEPAEVRLGYTSATSFDAHGLGEPFRGLLRSAAHTRGIGDFYGHMLVAAGSLDVMLEPDLRPWDLAPLVVIVEEAGGKLTDFEGRRDIYGGSALTTNGLVHESILELLRGKARDHST